MGRLALVLLVNVFPAMAGTSVLTDVRPIELSPAQVQQRIPRQTQNKTTALEGIVRQPGGRGVGGAKVTLRAGADEVRSTLTSAEGVFRLLDLPPATYTLIVEKENYETLSRPNLQLQPTEVTSVELVLPPLPRSPEVPFRPPPQPGLGLTPSKEVEPAAPSSTPYRQLNERPDEVSDNKVTQPEALAPDAEVFRSQADRWSIEMPEWNRYGKRGESPYVTHHWWDPFDRNVLKGDVPVIGDRTFLALTATSDTFLDARRLPSPSGVSTARPGSSDFFGRGEQAFLTQDFRFSFDLFHGDTAFRPVDWRIRVTPEFNINYLKTRELGLVNIDVRRGDARTDLHVGLQEAFIEYKLHNLSSNYDFISARAGIQSFSSDFRGFVFVDEQPGARIFGNLRSNRIQYNLAYFYMLEKNTNSGLNTFSPRHQQVVVANAYLQDFFFPGYTAEFSFHFNRDDASIHFDDNGFLVRPAPIGNVVSASVRPHNIRVGYLGWTGNGRIHGINISHAFYQALGSDDFNAIAGRAVTINAQMFALELSVDKDWVRFRSSFLWASGDANPRDGRAGGFDSIVDDPAFAGGIFSLWNREGIRLTGTGVQLTSPDSLLPSLRSSKEEGQSNVVNPGLFLYNLGADFEVTPKLRSFANVNILRFDRTEPLELLLFQSPIHHFIGVDYGIGFQYRPPLTENITLTTGASALTPGSGFRDIYTSRTLFSLFANLRLQF
jgi:hypothetical protein